MDNVENKIVVEIVEIKNSLETLSIKDESSWNHLAKRIGELIAEVSRDESLLLNGLEAVKNGMDLISNNRTKDALLIIDGIFDVLDYGEKYILNSEVCTDELLTATEQLIQQIGLGNVEDNIMVSSFEEKGEDSPLMSLNDAAMLLIQLEPQDTSGFYRLKNCLLEACVAGEFPNHVENIVTTAIEKIARLLDEDGTDSEAIITEINQLIDEAMLSMDGNDKTNENKQMEKEEINKKAISNIEDYMPADADMEMLGEFINESNDLITNAEEALLSLEVNPDDMEAVGMVFRAFHTVKGTSAFLELSLLSNMAHHAENLLSRVRDGEIRYCGGYADLSLKSLDMLKELIQKVEAALNGAALLKPEGYDELVEILSNPEDSGVSEEYDEVDSPRIGDILVAQGKVKREELENALSIHEGEHVGGVLIKSKMTTVSEVGKALRTQAKIKAPKQQHTVESTVRVSTTRLDKLIDMVGEMVIAQSMVSQDEIVVHAQNHRLQKKVSQTGKIVRELQDLSMSMRMVPLKSTFQKMARLVRDVSRKVGKNVNLVTEGEDTEIDRNLVDVINDPLVHMVRNSVDHGIELPDEREKAGKSRAGTVKLAAYHSAGNVVVEIKDDGKGLNRDLILEKAYERNLIEKGKTLTDREIYNLIFEPGFSTAQTVTDVSGRGVGMDVVKKNIEKLRGQVEINSYPGKGSVFRIYLPLTLAIIDGMVVRVGDESYVIPTEQIVRSIKPEDTDISHVLNQGEVLSLQGKLIPLFRLSELYNIGNGKKEAGQNLVVVLEDDVVQAGIIIDELVGRQQVVVKSLGESMKGIPGISGGAIMPNGRVGLIIDVGGLIKLAQNEDNRFSNSEEKEELKMAG